MRLALLLCLSLAACGPKVKNKCAGNTAGTCVTGEQCSYDSKQGCQVCQCAPLDNANKDDPFGNDKNPDDRSLPPEPVH
jgi:hypothetical protein